MSDANEWTDDQMSDANVWTDDQMWGANEWTDDQMWGANEWTDDQMSDANGPVTCLLHVVVVQVVNLKGTFETNFNSPPLTI